MTPEARLEDAEGGLVPAGAGWFVLNARDARWRENELSAYCAFEGDSRFPQLGVNLNVLLPGMPMSMYHREDDQEDFLVLAGECLLVVEDEERLLRAWDFVHCPAGTNHTILGAGAGPALVLAVGARSGGDTVYPESEVAQRLGAGVAHETTEPDEAYVGFSDMKPTSCRDGWLPS
jgi:uncharacterized cupin superfamily protein